jgi:hypothetical protein
VSITIITTKRNPKRKAAKVCKRKKVRKRTIRVRKNPDSVKIGDTVRIHAPGLPGHGKSGRVLGVHRDHYQIESGPNDHKNYMHPASRLTVIRARKNPVRIKLEKIIVAFVNTGPGRKMKRYYFNGASFSRDKHEAERYPGDAAKSVARKMLGRLPPKIHGLSIEKP